LSSLALGYRSGVEAMMQSDADQGRLLNKSDFDSLHLSSNCQRVKRVSHFRLVLYLGLTCACLAFLLVVRNGPWRSTFTTTGASTTDMVGLAAAPVQTCGGNHKGDDHGEGSVCIFPFQHRGRTYNKCTKAGRSQPWCATSYEGRSKRARSWGYCDCEEQFQAPSLLMTCGGERKPGIAQTRSMTTADYDAVVYAVVSEMNKLSSICTSKDCPKADFAGCVLRVAGHDFMDFHNGKGGSDGCTDMTDPDNAGLTECLSTGENHGAVSVALSSAYSRFCTKISLADFIVIAAEAVMTELRPSAGRADVDFRSNFRYGRRTAINNCKFEFVHGILPNPEGSCDEVDRVFVKNMGLTKAEATALSGVHTLGRARLENSGYEGWWSDPDNSRIFNNNYFVSIVAKGWGPKTAVDGNPNKNMWVRSDVDADKHNHEMMLNTDMCLAYFEDGKGLKADEHNCCAWFNPEFFSESRQRDVGLPPEVTDANGKELCGHEIVEFGVPSREICCETFGADKGKSEIDCGSPSVPNGLAGEDIILFAKDEKAWLQVFQTAWKKATENGAQGLQKLRGGGRGPPSRRRGRGRRRR